MGHLVKKCGDFARMEKGNEPCKFPFLSLVGTVFLLNWGPEAKSPLCFGCTVSPQGDPVEGGRWEG